MSYQPIESYGVIGDMRSVALVGKNGSIDWCCLPDFDSPSVFAGILDDQKGGFWSLRPATGETREKQMYLPDTNVLVTRFFSEEGMAEAIDFMSIGKEAGGESEPDSRQIVRIAKAIRGPIRFRMECRPAFDYARQTHEVHMASDSLTAILAAREQQFVLKSDHPMQQDWNGVVADFTLEGGEQAIFVLRHRGGKADQKVAELPLDAEALLTETVRFWRAWAAQSRYRGRWRETVTRSALVLKLLTYLPSGAIVAAPTTSLPELVGGVRNWDYRYTWVRDAAFTVYSLMRLGYTEEAAAFAHFMQARAKEEEPNGGPLNVMYGIDGRHDLPEVTLDHLEGYRGSRPVRVGNAAANHLQLDIYGELMDALYLYDKYGTPLSYEMWTEVERILDWLVKNWEQADQSIWDVRGGARQVHLLPRCNAGWRSTAACGGWRANARHFPPRATIGGWSANRIYITAILCGKAGTRRPGPHRLPGYFGGDAVDASLLMMMPLMLFVSPKDPRMVSTIARIRRELGADTLVRRYDQDKAARDGLPGSEGFFSVCSFWLVEAMARAGDVEEAQLLFEKLLSYGNHVGLFSEEVSAQGELLGNFPQALTAPGL